LGFFRRAVSVVFSSKPFPFSFSGGALPSTAFARESEGRVFETSLSERPAPSRFAAAEAISAKSDVRGALANADDGARRRRLEKCSAFSGLAYLLRERAPSSSYPIACSCAHSARDDKSATAAINESVRTRLRLWFLAA